MVAKLQIAKYLEPTLFGKVTFILTIITLFNILVDLGLKVTIIQRPRDIYTHKIYHTSFWITIMGGLLSALLYLTAFLPIFITSTGDSDLQPLFGFLAITIFINAISIVPEARLIKRLKLKKIAAAEVSSVAFSSLLAIFLVTNDFGPWAIFWQQASGSVLRTALIFRFSKWKPKLIFSWQHLAQVKEISIYQLGLRLIEYARANIDKILIGAILGPTSLGLYAIAYSFTEVVRTGSSQILTRVMLPALSFSHKGNHQLLIEQFLNFSRLMSNLLLMPPLCLFFLSDVLVNVFLDESWVEAATIIRVLSVSGVLYAISGPTPEVLQAIGKSGLLLKISTRCIVFGTIPFLLIGSICSGVLGASVAVVLSMAIFRLSYLTAVMNVLKVRWIEFIASLKLSILILLLSVGAYIINI